MLCFKYFLTTGTFVSQILHQGTYLSRFTSLPLSRRQSSIPQTFPKMFLKISTLFLILVVFTNAAEIASTTKKPEARKMEISDSQIEMALKDKRYLQRQLKCTLGEAPCDPVGRRLKTLAPLVLRGSCPQCTPTEMRQIQKVLLHMQRNFPKEWAKLVRTYQ